MDIPEKMRQVLKEAGISKVTRSPYDTAWIARLGDLDRPLSNQAMNWLAENQLPDGSWGASSPLYYHDRMICTLSAMAALALQGRRSQDRRQIERGQNALKMLSHGAPRGLMSDLAGPTIAFEFIMPTLLAEVESHDMLPHQANNLLGRLTSQRRTKLAKLTERAINRNGTAAFCAEMVGQNELQLLDVENLLEANGSVAYSPAATVFFALYVRPDPAAIAFLNRIASNGAVPYCAPIDIFEYAWVLWNAGLIEDLGNETLAQCQAVFKALNNVWDPKDGLGVVEGLSYKSADATAIAYQALTRFGCTVDLNGLLRYEDDEYFRCYALEVDPSLSTNVHVLGALRQAGLEVKHSSVQKVLRFLRQARTGRSFWFDKGHTSPYYPTCHAIIAAAGYADELVTSAVEWVVNTQNEDGSWGFYASSAEETAYCLQALAVWKRRGKGNEEIDIDILKRGADWLMEHMHDPYPWFWIGKSLYCPELVVESAILSALMLVEQS